jgi:hypothetical protein
MNCNTETIEELVEQLAAAIVAEIAGKEEATLLEWEGELCEVMQFVGQRSLSRMLEGMEGRYPAQRIACSCGEEACYRYRRPGTVLTHFGRVRYRRCYYVCDRCHQGQYPLDQKLQLKPGQVSARLSSELAMLGVQTAFGEAAKLVKALLLIDVSPTTIQQETHRFGEYQQKQEQTWQVEATDVDHLNERQKSQKGPTRLYGSLDGVIVPVEEEWRELKVGCWYEVKPKKHRYRPEEAAASETLRAEQIHYFCDFATASDFGQQLWASGYAVEADIAEEVVFVADGAAWIWNLVEHHFPNAVQIVDWYHAVAYLSPIAHAAFGTKDTQGKAWFKRVRKLLWNGQVKRVIKNCTRLQKKVPAASEPIQKALTYFTNNAQRMDYARLRKAGYFIGSGTVESACKQIGTHRLKRAGARWSQQGALLVAKARAAWLSGQWSQLIAQRIAA